MNWRELLLPWQLFAHTLTGSGNSLVANHRLINRRPLLFPPDGKDLRRRDLIESAVADLALRVEHLSKRYRIDQRETHHDLRDALAHAVRAPWRAVASLLNGGRSSISAPPSGQEIWAVRDISFEVMRGEALGIIGGNGAGKTTLLKILSRITEPTDGRAEIYDRVGSLLEVVPGFILN